jgi:dTDP-4-amino-4,6-dideoxygalactose transaminase
MTTVRASTSHPQVPFLDMGRMHAPLKAELLDAFADAIDRSGFVNGPAVAGFEAAFARYCGAARCVGVASGLDGLRLGLIAAGIGHGDEVVVPANTFAASVEAVVQAGAEPVLVDVTTEDYNLDVDAVRAAVGPRTRAVMPVHLYGQLADMRRLSSLAEGHGLTVIEDACQAHGAERDGIRAGTAGHAAAFSFYPGKNLGAMGDAGALTTSDDALADRVVALREHGQRVKYVHEYEGYTARLDAFQAIVLDRKLPLMDEWNAQRRSIAAEYTTALAQVGDLVLPPVAADSDPVWHLYVVQTADPVALADHLERRGIATGRHYPMPIHLSPAYERLGHGRGAFPVTERLADRLLSLPVFPGMREDEILAVTEGIADYFA